MILTLRTELNSLANLSNTLGISMILILPCKEKKLTCLSAADKIKGKSPSKKEIRKNRVFMD